MKSSIEYVPPVYDNPISGKDLQRIRNAIRQAQLDAIDEMAKESCLGARLKIENKESSVGGDVFRCDDTCVTIDYISILDVAKELKSKI